MMRQKLKALLAVSGILIALTACGGSDDDGAERAAATPIATFDTSSAETLRPAPSAGTPASRNMYNRPSLAAARFPGTTRLFRTIVRSQNDNVNLAQILLETQYKDVSSPNATWRPVDFGALGNRGSVGNFVQSDSTLYAFDTIALRSSAGNGQYIAVSRSSTNGGITWQQGWSRVQLPTTWSMEQIYLYQGIIVLTDGTWVMPAYSNGNVFLLASAPGDHGKTWRAVSHPYASHYTEATVAQRPDGRLVMAARYEIGRDESTEARRFKMGALGFRLSDRAVLRGDQLADVQWSAPRVNLPNVDQHGDLPLGVSPRMTRVGRYLLLTFGRPGNRLSWSTDGIDWSGSDPGGFYSNLPTFTSPCRELPGYIPCKALGSSGYIGVAVTDPQRGEGYLAFDACHTWSCEPVGSDYRIPENASWPAGATDQRVTLLRFQLNPQLVDPVSSSAPPSSSPQPTPASLDLSAAPVPSLCGQPAGRLVDGELPKPINNGFVALEQPLTVTGDVLGDTAPEAVGVIACSAGGVGWPNTIHIYGPGPKHLVQIDLTDHYNADGLVAIVESVEITDRTLVVRWVTDGPDDPISSPSITVEGRFTIHGRKVTADVR